MRHTIGRLLFMAYTNAYGLAGTLGLVEQDPATFMQRAAVVWRWLTGEHIETNTIRRGDTFYIRTRRPRKGGQQ
jgi:hypothetical protein